MTEKRRNILGKHFLTYGVWSQRQNNFFNGPKIVQKEKGESDITYNELQYFMGRRKWICKDLMEK